MFASFKWIAAAALAGVVAIVCAGGWLRAEWTAEARLDAAVAARDGEWAGKLAAANARAELAAASADLKALQAAQAVRFQLAVARKTASERVAALEQALGDNAAAPDPNPVVYPRSVARGLRR